jgi:Zn-dependent protease with chaperone function
VGGFLVYGLMAVVNTAGATIQLLIDSVAMPDSRRAEYLADLKAREVGGSDAFITSSERLLIAEGIWQDLWDQAPRTQPEQLPDLAERSAARRAGELRIRRQASRREVDLWSSHPCDDDRMTLVEGLPRVAPAFQLGDQRWARIDAELAGWYAHVHKHLLGTRDRIEHTS